MDSLSITLLWNSDEDLDLSFNCEDGVTIDWSYREATNDCGGVYDVEQGITQYNKERGDGSFG